MASSTNINQNNNVVTLQDNNGSLSITNNNTGTTVNVTQPVTNIVSVATIGPQGPVGPIPSSGAFTGSFSGSVAAPGSTTQVVFNNGGVLGANSGFVYSGSRVGIGLNNTQPAASLHISSSSDTPASSSLLIQNSNQLPSLAVLDNGDVGVGTNAPTNKLHILGSGYAFAQVQAGGFGSMFIGASGGLGIIYNNNNNPIWIDSANDISLRTNSTPRLYITTTGKVGIGVTTPTAQLEVKGSGTTSATEALRVTDSNGTSKFKVFDNGGISQGTSTNPSGNDSFSQGTSNSAYGGGAHSEGLFTIASASYSHAEGFNTQAEGNFSHTEGQGNTAVGDSSHAEGINNISNGLGSHAEGFATIASGIGSHTEGFGTITVDTAQHAQGQYNLAVSGAGAFILGNGIDDSNRSNLIFASGSQVQITGSLDITGSVQSTGGFTGSFSGSVAAPGSTTQVVFNNGGVLGANSGFVYSGSRIGIGTTTPSQSLDLRGSMQISGSIFPFADSVSYLGDIALRFTQIYARGLSAVGNSLDIAGSNINLNDSAGNTLARVTGATGNVGIGMSTTAPTARLQVRGSGATSSTTALRVENTNASSSLVVLDSGNVGIGTTTPLSPLDIRGTQTAAGSIARTMLISSSLSASANNDVLVGLDIVPSFNTGSFTGITSAPLRIRNITNTGNIFFIDQIGNAVIGGSLSTNTVYGPANLNISSGNNNLILQTNFTANAGLTMFNSTRNIVIQNGGTFTDAGYRLDVSGSIRVQDHFTQTSGFALINSGNTLNLRSNLAGGSGYITSIQSYNTLNGPNTEQGFGTFEGTYAPTSTSGTPSFNAIKLLPTINQTGGANGITRGLYVNPTLTSASSWRSIEWSNNTGFGLYGIGGATNYLSGSLGIGTTTPSYKLDVSGSAKINEGIYGSGTTGNILPLATTTGTGTVVIGGTSPNTPALRFQGSPLIFFIGSTQVAQLFATTGNLTLQNGGTFTDRGYRLDVSGSGNFTNDLTVTGSLIAGSTSVSSFTASNATISGNVTVLGTASINSLIVNQIGYSSGSNQLGDAANDTQTLYGTVVIPTGSLTVTGSTIISSSAATQLRVGTNALFVSSSGTVGIGTITPSDTFHLVGGLRQTRASGILGRYDITSANANQVLGTWDFYTNTAVSPDFFGKFGFKFEGGTTDAFKQYQIHVADFTTPKLVVDGAGRVGIGTITPTASLHISGAASSTLLIVTSSAATALFVSGSGNVGIGTNTPGMPLSVVGNAQFGFTSTSAGARLHTRGAGTTSTSTSFRADNANQLPALRITDDLSARFDGKVSIGSGNFPTASLDIAGTTRISGSFNTATSGSILTVIGSGSAQPIFTVQGSQGELFSITDSLSGSLFSVNDISGLPILEVFSDNTTLIGNYQDPMLITTAKVVQTNSGSFTVYSLPTASYDTAFFEYSIKSGSNARAGTIMAMQLGSTVNFTETTTTDFGDTTAISFTVIVTGSNMALTGSSTTGSWTTKCIVRGL